MPSERLRPLAALRVLGLLVALACGLGVPSPAAAGENDVCKPDPDCRPLCRAKARALLERCAEGGGARDACRRAARELRSACAASECGGGCEQRCEILGQKLLQGCIGDGGALELCREQADLASAACIEERCRPCICPQVYDPVCGADGMTYGNACEAACAKVEVVHEGPCEPKCPPVPCDVFCEFGHRPGPDGCPTCSCNAPPGCRTDDDCGEGQTCRELCSLRPCLLDQPDCAPCVGVCLPKLEPCFCPEVYQPVCGADGKTYSNACHAGCAGVDVVHEGECRRECGRNAECEAGEVCHPPTGTCRPQCAIQCFRYDPVCGTDGVTYGCGEADAHCHGVEVEHEGACGGACGPDQSCTQ